MTDTLTGKRREILDFIAAQVSERGYPPSVREIGFAVGLASTSTVQAHLNTLQRQGYLRRDPTKPRALEVRYDSTSGAAIERRHARHVPLVGDIAAGTNVLASENVEELLPLPEDFTGSGNLFMLRVRGESMVGAGILDGDYVVVRQQAEAHSGRHCGRWHPRRGGNREDILKARRRSCPPAGQPEYGSDGFPCF